MLVLGLTVGVTQANAEGTLVPPGQICIKADKLNEILAKNGQQMIWKEDLQKGWVLEFRKNPTTGEWSLMTRNPDIGGCLISVGKENRA